MTKPKLVFSLQKMIVNSKKIIATAEDVFAGRNIHIYYSLKANYNHRVLSCLFNRGLGAEVGRLFELKMIPENSNQQIVINGHYKSDKFIKCAIERNVTRIHVESLSELIRIENIAKSMGTRINIGIRIKIDVDRKVGADTNEIQKLSRFRSPHIQLKSLHFHLGWNEQNKKIAMVAADKILSAFALLNQNGHPIDTFNFGGSFIEPSVNPGQAYERLKQYSKILPPEISNIELEVGRYLTGDCGLIYANAIEVRDNRVLIDTCAYGHRLMGATPGVDILAIGSRSKIDGHLELSGHWASENDKLELSTVKHLPRVGDIVKLRNFGAYLDSWFDQLCLDEPIGYEFLHPYDILYESLESQRAGSGSILNRHWDYRADEISALPKDKNERALMLVAIEQWLKINLNENHSLEQKLRIIFCDYSTLRRELSNVS